MDNILQAIWLFFPAAAANATPVFASRLHGLRHLNQPIDGGRKFRGRRILGANKTWRGLGSGVAVAVIAGLIQHYIWPSLLPLVIQLALAAAIGFGALYGDMVESFFKRQLGKKSGQTWFPFDQLDYIIGGVIASLPFGVFGLSAIAAIFAAYFLLHLASVCLGYFLGIRDQPI